MIKYTPIPIGKIGPKPNWLLKRMGKTPFHMHTYKWHEFKI